MEIHFTAKSKEYGNTYELISNSNYSKDLIESIQNDTIDHTRKYQSFSNFLDCYFNDGLRSLIIEELLTKIRNEYNDVLRQLSQTQEYQSVSELEKIELEKREIYTVINNNRKIRSYFDNPVRTIIEPIDLDPLKDFIGYDEEEISFISSLLDNKSSTTVMQPDFYEYEVCKKLYDKGTLLKGEEIQETYLLEQFTVKDLNELFKKDVGRKFKNRPEAIEFAINQKDLKVKLSSIKALSQIYFLDKKQFNVTDNKVFENSYNFLWEYYQKMSTIFNPPDLDNDLVDDSITFISNETRDELHFEGFEVEVIRKFFNSMSSEYEEKLKANDLDEYKDFLSIKDYIFE